MNKTVEIITKRVSCRSYLDKRVSKAKLEQILEAGKYAPSAMNRQICNIIEIKSKALLERIREALKEKCNRECLYEAKHLVLVSSKKDDRFAFQDGSCILENMFIAAAALKIDSCWINQLDDLLSDEKYKRLRKRVGLADDEFIVGSAIFGYRKDEDIPSKKRKDDFIRII